MRPPPQPQMLDQASTEQAAPKGAGTTGTRYSGQRKFLGVPQETVDRQCEEDEADGAVDGSQYQLSIDISESGRRYVEPDGIYAQLRCNLGAEANVKLLKWSWLDARAREMQSVRSDEERRRLALPRRQDIEATDQGAFYSSAEIAALPRGNMSWAGGPLAVVAVSYCWETPSHPDPEGRTLLSIARAIRRAQQQHIGRHHERLPAELGIFLDWCSLHQKDANGERTPSEAACFADALGSMQLWFASSEDMALCTALERPLAQPLRRPRDDARAVS